MNKLIVVATLSVLGVLLGACQTNSEIEPADYIAHVVSSATDCGDDSATSESLETLIDSVEQNVDELDEVSPPDQVAVEHNALLESTKSVLAVLNDADSLEDIRDDEDFVALSAFTFSPTKVLRWSQRSAPAMGLLSMYSTDQPIDGIWSSSGSRWIPSEPSSNA